MRHEDKCVNACSIVISVQQELFHGIMAVKTVFQKCFIKMGVVKENRLFFLAEDCCFTCRQRARVIPGLEPPTFRLSSGDLICFTSAHEYHFQILIVTIWTAKWKCFWKYKFWKCYFGAERLMKLSFIKKKKKKKARCSNIVTGAYSFLPSLHWFISLTGQNQFCRGICINAFLWSFLLFWIPQTYT